MKIAALTLAILIGGAGYAQAPKSYLDPSYGKIQASDIVKPAQPFTLKLVVEFQRNGKHLPSVDGLLRSRVSDALESSGFATVVPDSASVADELSVVVNNIADLGEARRKGFITGSTFFLKGSTVTDNYEMQATITIAGKTVTRSGYKEAIQTIIGRGKVPAGIAGITLTDAVYKAFEQLVFQFLRDLPVAEFTKSSPSISNSPQPTPATAPGQAAPSP